jgi:hypothetical protein
MGNTAVTKQEENNLICEKLLGWTRVPGNQYTSNLPYWQEHDSIRTPSFTTWADAGLILEALVSRGVYVSVHHGESGDNWKSVMHWNRYEKMSCKFAITGPAAIRAVSLDFIRSLP